MSCDNYDKRILAKEFRSHMTVAEDVFWQHVRHNRLDGYQFRRQTIISGFIVDFVCKSLDLVVEINGNIHKFTQEYDQERSLILEQKGFTVLCFTNEDVLTNISQVLSTIRNYANKYCGKTSPPSSP